MWPKFGHSERQPFLTASLAVALLLQICGISKDKGWDCIDGELIAQVPVHQDKAVVDGERE